MKADTVTISREELYNLVWSEAMKEAAKRFNISNVALRKICRKHNIPTPPFGYWKRLKHGNPATPTPLPPRPNAPMISITVMRRWPELSLKRVGVIVEARKRKEQQQSNRVQVRQRLRAPHRITRLTQDALLSARVDDYGMVKCEYKEAFFVRVAPSSVHRALRILDALVKACEKRGFAVKHGREGKKGQARFLVDGEEIEFRIEEHVHSSAIPLTPDEMLRVRRDPSFNPHRYTHHPTGDLVLRVRPHYRGGPQTTWKDTAGQRVEEVLNDVIISMIHVAALKREERRLEAEDDRQQRQAVEHQQRSSVQEITDDQAVEQLRADAAAWHEAQIIHAFLDVVEVRAKAEGVLATGGKEDRWLAWARDMADELDPLGGYDEPVFDDDDQPVTPRPGTPGNNVVSFVA